MDWGQYLAIVVPLAAFMVFIYREIKDWKAEIRAEINSIRQETSEQAKRSDRLYEMFIDLVKSQPKTNP